MKISESLKILQFTKQKKNNSPVVWDSETQVKETYLLDLFWV